MGPGRADDRVCTWVFSNKALGSGPSESRYPDPGTDYRHCGSSLARGNRTPIYPIDRILVWLWPRTTSATAATVTGRARLCHSEGSSAAPAQQTKQKSHRPPGDGRQKAEQSFAWQLTRPPATEDTQQGPQPIPFALRGFATLQPRKHGETAWVRTSLPPGIAGRHRQSRVQNPGPETRPGV